VNGAAMRALAAALATVVSLSAFAASPPVDDVAFAPPPSAQLPLDARFADEHGRTVRLGDYLEGRRAIVVPAYYGCSNLCTVVLEGLAASLDNAQMETGSDLDVVVASISPLDTPAAALAKKRAVLGEPEPTGWHFLTGDRRAIAALTNALGYRYAYDEDAAQYAHAAGIVLVAPGGRVAQTLYGVTFAAGSLRKFGVAPASSPERWLLCFRFDPRTGRYTFVALQAVRLVAFLSFATLAAFLIRVWLLERRAER
jgi:protein SCO1/2